MLHTLEINVEDSVEIGHESHECSHKCVLMVKSEKQTFFDVVSR